MKSSLLAKAYCELEYDQGDLVHLSNHNLPIKRSLDVGEWLHSCKKINKKSDCFAIDALFFVKDNPAIVFGTCNSSNELVVEQAYINVWNLARPQYLFLEINGELLVYDFAKYFSTSKGKKTIPSPIELVKTANEIRQKLQGIERSKVEAGIVQLNAKNNQNRADKTLISDVKKIRTELMKLGLKGENIRYAHSIIGRSIFIRYLEDRGILTNEYFSAIASRETDWILILAAPLEGYVSLSEGTNENYIRCLRNKEFTYALYRELSQDFNGDMFPIEEHEETIITAEHLLKISEFLQGKFDEQMRLFFWAYKFDVIPMELMSNLYEEFYHKQTETDNNGTHYTPLSLVEFIIKQALPIEVLENNPNVLDPCCGSGIFLVEAFKRIVRYNIIKNKGFLLSCEQLKFILKTQIRGIELTDEALSVAAFSLYVAFLDFQESPCILEQMKKGKYLPNLKCNIDIKVSFDILLNADAFSGEANNFIGDSKADIVIGNPPWGKADSEAIRWCKTNNLPLGDKEYSQAFIWRTISWTKKNGAICLLLPISIFSKSNSQNAKFKNMWLNESTIKQIVNFAHSRRVFFQKGIAPFMSALFTPNKAQNDNYVTYWSAKMNSLNINHQYIVLEKADMHFIRQSTLLKFGYAWKTLWWGGLSDLSLVNKLKTNTPLMFLPEIESMKQGFTSGKGETKSIESLSEFKKLSLKSIVSYGSIQKFLIDDVPVELHRNFSSFEIFGGNRIIFKRGISNKGIVVSRFESVPFSFTNDIHCIKFKTENEALIKSICAILISSISKYYFFLTCSGWGMWHDEIHLDELEQFPIPSIIDNEHTRTLCLLLDEIKSYEEVTLVSQAHENQRCLSEIIKDIDGIVFEMYQLTDDEKSLITDMCYYGLDLFYNKADSISVKCLPPVQSPLFGNESTLPNEIHLIYSYIKKIVSAINKYLISIEAELEWRVYRSKGVIAVLFLTKYINDPIGVDYESKDEWEIVLREYSRLSKQTVTKDIYTEGSFVGVSENCIAIIKKDEHRNWCESAAVKDLKSVLLKLIDKDSMEVNGDE